VEGQRPRILISNDDGIRSTGLKALHRRLSDLGEVVVVAPDRERSATSHSFTLDRPLRVSEVEPGWFAVDGTPADCVYLGLLKLCPSPPQLLVSGINHGFNLGSDVFYSGTVACAVEAALRDVPAIAVSLEWKRGLQRDLESFSASADLAHALARAVLREGLPKATLLNVNVPQDARPGAYQWTCLGRRLYRDQVDERADLRGRRYYWIGGPAAGYGDVPGSDCHAVRDRYASVTPLDLDLTHEGLLERLPSWRLDGFEAAVEEDLAAAGGASGTGGK
jgi:5'-nucleotidase